MDRHTLQSTLLGGLLAGFAGAGACQALPAEPPKTTGTAAPSASVAPPQAAARPIAGWGSPTQQAALSGSRGGADTVSNDARLSATVSNNTATNVTTGNNVIDGGSFANMTGLPMVIQNTGANVLIQNATVINLQLR